MRQWYIRSAFLKLLNDKMLEKASPSNNVCLTEYFHNKHSSDRITCSALQVLVELTFYF